MASPGPSLASTQAFYSSSGHNNTWFNNIVDLGTAAVILNLDYELFSGGGAPTMSGNSIYSNIFIGKWSGAQASYASGNGPNAYINGGASVYPTNTYNMYYNYGSGSLSTTSTSNNFNDASPVTGTNPLISGTIYTLASNSPAFNSPVNFSPIVGGWGPPGYTIPTGTAPCYS